MVRKSNIAIKEEQKSLSVPWCQQELRCGLIIKGYKPGKGLAFDYGQKEEEIEEAIRCELQAA